MRFFGINGSVCHVVVTDHGDLSGSVGVCPVAPAGKVIVLGFSKGLCRVFGNVGLCAVVNGAHSKNGRAVLVKEGRLMLIELPDRVKHGVRVGGVIVADIKIRFGRIGIGCPALEGVMSAGRLSRVKHQILVKELVMNRRRRSGSAVCVIGYCIYSLKMELVGAGRHISTTTC